jgi:hypothetical protein
MYYGVDNMSRRKINVKRHSRRTGEVREHSRQLPERFRKGVERDDFKYRVYDRHYTPLKGSQDFYDVSTQKEAYELAKRLSRETGRDYVWV